MLRMDVAKSLDKPIFLYTEHTDNTVFSVEWRKSSMHSAKSVYKESGAWTLLQPGSNGCALDTSSRQSIITSNRIARRQVSIKLLREPSVGARWSAYRRNPLRPTALAGINVATTSVVHQRQKTAATLIVRGTRAPVIAHSKACTQNKFCGTAKAGGTTRRPLVLRMDRGRILFRTEVQHVRHQFDPREARDCPHGAQEPPNGFVSGGRDPRTG